MDKWDSKKLPNEFAQNFDTGNHVSTTKDKIMSNGTIVNNNNVFNYLGIEQRGSFRISASRDGKRKKEEQVRSTRCLLHSLSLALFGREL